MRRGPDRAGQGFSFGGDGPAHYHERESRLPAVHCPGVLSMHLFAAVATVILAQPAQPKDAQDWFKTMEKKLTAAKTVRIVPAIKVEGAAKVKGLPVPLKCKVWIDTETFLPVKRTLLVAGGGLEYRYMETFNEVVLDEKVDPKTFELPQ